jgi:hypothetical protein
MLHGEKHRQTAVDCQGGRERPVSGAVQPGRGEEPADEPDRVEERRKEQDVAQDTVRQNQ